MRGAERTHEIVPLREVWFEEEPDKRRTVIGDCRVCFSSPERYGVGVVSPSGLAHIVEHEQTACGHDATGPEWWWEL